MKHIWSEATIRKELARLDAKTGLKGAMLSIILNNSKCTLGSYNVVHGGIFEFSRFYFEDPSWPIEEALDTIRHEYAHYMDYMIYGNLGHGITWKKCCIEVGALPISRYSNERAKYYQDKHRAECEKSANLDGYRAGTFIVHPRFGKGRIEEIVGASIKRNALVSFKDMEIKTLSLAWVDKNCERC